MTTGEISNTPVSQRIKKILAESLERKSKVRKDARVSLSKKKKDGTDTPADHASAAAPLRGVLGKGDSYALQARDYLKGKDGRGVYRNFDFPHLDGIRKEIRAHAEFPGGPKKNFDKNHTQKHPYSWAAHHMLPGSAFYYELDGKRAFTAKQLSLVLQSDYNINHGHNMIMLPMEDWAALVHTLICHPSDHPKYTKMIIGDLKEMGDDIQKKIDKAEPHEAIVVDVFEELKDLEDGAWDFLVKLSRKAVPQSDLGIQLQHEVLKYKTKTKTYSNPVLG